MICAFWWKLVDINDQNWLAIKFWILNNFFFSICILVLILLKFPILFVLWSENLLMHAYRTAIEIWFLLVYRIKPPLNLMIISPNLFFIPNHKKRFNLTYFYNFAPICINLYTWEFHISLFISHANKIVYKLNKYW